MKKIIILLTAIILQGCSSIPLSTMWKMKSFDEEDFSQLTPQYVRVKFRSDKFVDVPQKNLRLEVKYQENEKPKSASFKLEQIESGSKNIEQWFGKDFKEYFSVLRLAPESIKQFKEFQTSSFLKKEEEKRIEFIIAFGFAENEPESYIMSIDLSLNEDGDLSEETSIYSKSNVSIYNPQWSLNNELYFAADQNGWWHLYHQDNLENPIHEFKEIEFAFPQWQFACNSFQIFDNYIITIGTQNGVQNLYKIGLKDGSISQLEESFCYFNGELQKSKHKLFFMAASKDTALSVYSLDLDTASIVPIKALESNISKSELSEPQHICFPTTNETKAYGFFYPPQNSQSQSEEELPPLIVMSHGGPTGMTDAGFDLQMQFWTSRGFAVADVNYRGSTGYGREYRDALRGNWGIYDVDDCIAMAEHLANEGLVDGKRLAIRGGSAGGYTTLCALTFHDKFRVGMSRYGVADLMSLAQDSHKFEIRYLDSVVGPLPEANQLYLDRSPSEHTDKLSCPILLLQGLDDKVVPPSQSEAMVKALKAKGLAYEYIEFEGEGHGFRKPETIVKAFEAELEFYKKYLL